MSTKLSFFEIPRIRDIGIEVLADRMETEIFDEQSASGFLLDRRSQRRTEGRYIQRIASEETIIDPLGRPHRQESLYYVEQRFMLRDTYPHFIVFNANASLRPLTGRLSEFSDFKMTISNLEWPIEGVLAALSAHSPRPMVYAAKVDAIQLSPSVQARLICEGSSDDIQKEVRDFLRAESISFASFKVEFLHAGVKRRCEIRADGVIQAYGEYDPALVGLWIKIVGSLRP